MEIAETENALEEIKNSSSDIYKLSGTIMLKADKEKTIKELEEKNKLMELRLSSIEKQESILESRAEGLKKETQKLAEDKNVGK